MEILAQVLGYVLAELKILQGEPGTLKTKEDTASGLSQTEDKLLKIAIKRLETINTSPDKPRVREHLVEYRCQGDKPFLQGNLDFFLLLLFGKSDAGGKYCQQVFQHLNICYQCFEDFSEVMRYYYFRLQERDPNKKQD